MKLENYLNLFFFETFIFDFDGTLFLSNDIKKEGFYYCASCYPNGNKVMKFILENSIQKDRYSIFKIFSRIISNKKLSEVSLYKKLIVDYHNFTLENICKLKPITGSLELLKKLKRKDKFLFINSATPYSSLNEIMRKLEIFHYFDGIFGMEASKLENLKKIKEESHSNKRFMIMIGDGIDDKQAATQFKIDFLPVGQLLTKSYPNYSRFI